jgi:hypothetical protein
MILLCHFLRGESEKGERKQENKHKNETKEQDSQGAILKNRDF